MKERVERREIKGYCGKKGGENARGMKEEETEGRQGMKGEEEQRTVVYSVNGY